MQDPKSFIFYKKDQRGILEVSPKCNEVYIDQQKAKYDNLKTKLKYRLYGADGVSDFEVRNLVKMGEIDKKAPHYPLPDDPIAMRKAIDMNNEGNMGFKIQPLCPEIFERSKIM